MCGGGSREAGGSAVKAMMYCFKNINKGKTKSLSLTQCRGDSAGSLPRELLVSEVTSPTLLPADRPWLQAGRCPICEKRDEGIGPVL